MSLRETLNGFFQNLYYDIHAIYDPEGLGASYLGNCYTAAVDLFEPGMTFKVYFKILDDGAIKIIDIHRWYMG